MPYYSHYLPRTKQALIGNDLRWMAGGRPVSYLSELRGDQPYLQAGNTPATSLDPGNEMAQDRIDYLRSLAPNDPERTNMDPAELASMFNTLLGHGHQAVQDKVRDATTPAPGQGTTLAQFAGRHAQAAVPALVKNAPRIASGVSGAANYLKNRFMPSGPNSQVEELRRYLENRPDRINPQDFESRQDYTAKVTGLDSDQARQNEQATLRRYLENRPDRINPQDFESRQDYTAKVMNLNPAKGKSS
jgi:hypothetical protein